MKTLELTLSERVFALKILNEFKGNHEVLALILEDIVNFPVSNEEWEKGERIIEENKETKTAQWRWDDGKAGLKSIEVHKEVAKYVLDAIDSQSEKGLLTLQDRAAISLRNKLITK